MGFGHFPNTANCCLSDKSKEGSPRSATFFLVFGLFLCYFLYLTENVIVGALHLEVEAETEDRSYHTTDTSAHHKCDED